MDIFLIPYCTALMWPSDQIAAIMASRFLLTPLIAAAMLVLGSRMELVPSDKLMWFVLLMQA